MFKFLKTQKIMKTQKLLPAVGMIIALLAMAVLPGQAQEDENKKKRKKRYGTHNDCNIDLGINNYLEDGNSPTDNNALYSVRPFGSWYVAIKSTNDTHVAGPIHLLWGADVSWYNFKFENESVRLSEGPDNIVFSEATGDFDPIKSKLTAAYINASVVPMLRFGERHRHNNWFDWDRRDFGIDWDDRGGFRIGAGVYGGYKIASYAKYVMEEEGDKDKDRDKDGFYLNNFRYGVRMQAGFRGIDVFVNYDLNELFVENRGPKLNAFSFGVVL